MIKVVIVDDSPDFLDSAAQFLEAEPGITVVGRAGSGAEAMAVVEALRPDVALIDIAMPDMSGLEATRRIKARPSAPKVLFVSLHDSAEHRRAAEAAGADGYVGKWEFASVIASAIRAVSPCGTRGGREARAGCLRTRPQPPHLASASLGVAEVPGEAGRASAGGGSIPARARRRVLVVDDEPIVAEVIADIIASSGHDVATARSATEALHRLEQGRFDLLLVDLRMPGLDGRGFYREIERRHPDLARRLVFMTGDALSPETRELLAGTDVPVLAKPFTLAELRRLLAAPPPPERDAGA
jgi:CheY-like chemotaxis protein